MNGPLPYTPAEFDDFVNNYVAAALFSSTDEDGNHLDADGYPLSVELTKLVRHDCHVFLCAPIGSEGKRVADLLRDLWAMHTPGSPDDTVWGHAGRDLWYTSQGHGCGFWDGDWPEKPGELLAKIAKQSPGAGDDWYVHNRRIYSGGSYVFRRGRPWTIRHYPPGDLIGEVGQFSTYQTRREAEIAARRLAKDWPGHIYLPWPDPDAHSTKIAA